MKITQQPREKVGITTRASRSTRSCCKALSSEPNDMTRMSSKYFPLEYPVLSLRCYRPPWSHGAQSNEKHCWMIVKVAIITSCLLVLGTFLKTISDSRAFSSAIICQRSTYHTKVKLRKEGLVSAGAQAATVSYSDLVSGDQPVATHQRSRNPVALVKLKWRARR
jgi:hypothetical protein